MKPKNDNKLDELELKVKQLQGQKTFLIILMFLLISSNIIMYFKHDQVLIIIDYICNRCIVFFNYLAVLIGNTYLLLKSSRIDIRELFNNREIALGIWILLLVLYMMSSRKFRHSIGGTIKLVLSLKFILIYIYMGIYTASMVYLLYSVGFWEAFLLKDTIIWFIFVATVSAFRALDKGKDIKYFLTAAKDCIKMTLIIEFIANSYTFSLLGELILLPFMFIIGMATAVLDINPEFQNEKSKPLKKIFEYISVGIGVYVIYNAVVLAINDISNFGSISSLKSMLLHPILSILFLGFVYFFALWSGYEQIFIRLPFGEKKSKSLILYIKLKILMLCNININKVNEIWKKHGVKLLDVKSRNDVLEILNEKNKSILREL